jgi:hypothetical protein
VRNSITPQDPAHPVSRDFPLVFSARVDRILDHLPPGRCIATACALPFVAGALLPGAWLSYSRDHNWYVGRQRYYGPAYTAAGVMGAVARLASADLLLEQRVAPGTHSNVRSRIKATPKLYQLLNGAAVVPVEPAELIILRDRGRVPVGYADTDHTRAMRRQIAEINEYLSDLTLGIEHPAVDHVDDHHIWIGQELCKQDKNAYLCPWRATPCVRRIFCRRQWDKGGRLYGLHQQMTPAARCALTINGEPVACLDYKAMHTTMVHNMLGVAMPDDDPYTIAGFTRDEVKVGMNIYYNAATRTGAQHALASEWAKARRRRYPNRVERERADQTIEAIKGKHAAIASAFESDLGVDLQHRDSNISLAVMQTCRKRGIPALRVHDEIDTTERHADEVRAIMIAAFGEAVPGQNRARVERKGGGTRDRTRETGRKEGKH